MSNFKKYSKYYDLFYEDKNYKNVNGANDISKILLESWSKIKQ